MGVPAFFRYMMEKYPRIIQALVEDRVPPDDLTQPLPQPELEFDNLYIDMNGIIHPCSHPEDRPAPSSETEMFHNVTRYVDRLFCAVRPKKVLFLAMDGVAPRAKMNQQRARRFRAAQDANERNALMDEVRQEMGLAPELDEPDAAEHEWDSNVITPGTDFMHNLSAYLRFYIAERMNNDKAWRQVTVVLSDSSEPGEGEHKIMSYIRQQRSMPGYNANIQHVLHGLDADLIMLGLALHEAHFYVLREEVLFGRQKSEGHNTKEQDAYDAMKGNGGLARVSPQDAWLFSKPLQLLSIPVLREYLQAEFGALATRLPFGWDFERIIDDFVFLCFFVGNDFLPHLPTLDIRDGAIDFLYNVYKRVLPTLGSYLTAPGGVVNLANVDVILAEVGAIEDEVFRRRKSSEDANKMRNAQRKAVRRAGVVGSGIEKLGHDANELLKQQALPVGGGGRGRGRMVPDWVPQPPPPPSGQLGPSGQPAVARGQSAPPRGPPPRSPGPPERSADANKSAAQKLRAMLARSSSGTSSSSSQGSAMEGTAPDAAAGGGGAAAGSCQTRPAAERAGEDKPTKKRKKEAKGAATSEGEGASAANEAAAAGATSGSGAAAAVPSSNELDGIVSMEDESEHEAAAQEGDKWALVKSGQASKRDPTATSEQQEAIEARVKTKQQELLDEYSEKIEDEIRFWQAGWKDRYYADKYKENDIAKGGGRERVFHQYVMGLCWVMRYYYAGCASWKWYYPFHYAPFASDLRNIEQFKIEFEEEQPFKPIEQLMAVLPKESCKAVPECCQKVMLDVNSEIADFYPEEVEIDPNGKAMPWLWVVLLPFIDEDRLLKVMGDLRPQFDEQAKLRNEVRTSFLFVHSAQEALHSAVLANIDGTAQNVLAPADAGAAADREATNEGVMSADLDPAVHGLGGVLLGAPCHPDHVPLRLGATIAAPKGPFAHAWDDISNNQVVCVCYRNPPAKPHQSALLPGARLPAPRLTAHDVQPRRPRLNRGMNIGDLGRGHDQHHQGAGGFGGGPRGVVPFAQYQLAPNQHHGSLGLGAPAQRMIQHALGGGGPGHFPLGHPQGNGCPPQPLHPFHQPPLGHPPMFVPQGLQMPPQRQHRDGQPYRHGHHGQYQHQPPPGHNPPAKRARGPAAGSGGGVHSFAHPNSAAAYHQPPGGQPYAHMQRQPPPPHFAMQQQQQRSYQHQAGPPVPPPGAASLDSLRDQLRTTLQQRNRPPNGAGGGGQPFSFRNHQPAPPQYPHNPNHKRWP